MINMKKWISINWFKIAILIVLVWYGFLISNLSINIEAHVDNMIYGGKAIEFKHSGYID